MASPMFEALNGKNAQNNSGNPFVDFMNQHKGEDPNAIISDMMRSGRINQSQLNAAQARAQKMGGMFDGFRKMFGF